MCTATANPKAHQSNSETRSRAGAATTFATLSGLLVVTGMRSVNASHWIARMWISLTGGHFTSRREIREVRLVSPASSTRNALKPYAALRHQIFPQRKDNRFFVRSSAQD